MVIDETVAHRCILPRIEIAPVDIDQALRGLTHFGSRSKDTLL
jgi:hypothetical protein